MIAKMNHPNVVAFILIPEELTNEYPPQTSLGMEYCKHGDLRKVCHFLLRMKSGLLLIFKYWQIDMKHGDSLADILSSSFVMTLKVS